jgi:hypothetical protein
VPELFEGSAANLTDSKQNASSGNILGRTTNINMKILNTTCRLESQRDVLERSSKPQAAITPHILCISLLALLTGCSMDIAIKPDKVPRGGSGTAPPTHPGYTNQVYPNQVYPDQDGGFGFGAQPVSNPNMGRLANPTWAG